MYEVWESIRWALGLGTQPQTLTFLQMALRTVIIFVAGLIMVRLSGDRHFGGRYTDFDVILSVAFGSFLIRAIMDTYPSQVR